MLLSREAYPSHPILLVGSIKPVVSSSSTPDTYDVGSTSSEICTAVTGVSGTTNPSAGCRWFPNIRHKLATVGSATPSHSLFGLRHSLPRAAPSTADPQARSGTDGLDQLTEDARMRCPR